MKKIFHLSTCKTCQRFFDDLGKDAEPFIQQDVKREKITPEQLDELKGLAGSYEALFNRRALKYRELGLQGKKMSEADYRKYLLEEYTFLKRPVIVNGKEIFIGNTTKTISAAKMAIKKNKES